MARKLTAPIVLVTACLFTIVAHAQAGDDALKKQLAELNRITGNDSMRGALRTLVADKKKAEALLKFGLPAAKKRELSYNAALVLGLAAGELKDNKIAEAYLRVCMEKAAKLQSVDKLRQSYTAMSDLYFDAKQFADSARICKELLELNTDDETKREVRRTVVDRFGEVDIGEPEEGFKTALRLRPYVYENYVKSVAKQGKHDQALGLVDIILKGKNDWIDLSLKGWVYRDAGKDEDAAKVYEDVLKQINRDPRFEPEEKDAFIAQFRYDLSGIYVDMKKIDRASEHLEYLIKKNPENPNFYNDLGYIWADNDMKLEEAEKHIRKALDLDRERRKKRKNYDPKTDHDNGAYLDSLGWVQFKQKRNEEAKESLLKALQDKSAQHLEIFDHLADVHMALGERELAIKAWQDGLKVASESRRDLERKVLVEKKLEKAKQSK
jgi:tetratricopeptide (TPR) repeat protein